MDHQDNTLKIGQLAQMLDAEYTIIQRMKIKKETIKRVGYALIFYASIMILFTLVL
ncbi:MAG TPA: hypothetical protein VKP59_04830 [Candidatus Thermoplasmatota archaeon]|nr:hypothetical protein [Candidatus Thermoplasmatota archaeon]